MVVAVAVVLAVVPLVQAEAKMRIPDSNTHPRNALIIDITDKCNYTCPWCGGAKGIKNTWNTEQLKLFRKHITEHPYKMYSFHGGEPLLDIALICKIAEAIYTQSEKARINLFTNGTLLTHENIEIIKQYRLHTCISIQASGYKDISQFLSHYKDPEESLKEIKTIPNLKLRYVWNLQTPLLPELTLLAKMFNCTIEITPDHFKLKAMEKHHVQQMKEVQSYINERYALHIDLLHSNSRWCCDCRSNRRRFYTDGFIGWESDVPKEQTEGCIMFKTKMKPDVYALYKGA